MKMDQAMAAAGLYLATAELHGAVMDNGYYDEASDQTRSSLTWLEENDPKLAQAIDGALIAHRHASGVMAAAQKH